MFYITFLGSGTVRTGEQNSGFGIVSELVEHSIPRRAYFKSTSSLFGRFTNAANERALADGENKQQRRH